MHLRESGNICFNKTEHFVESQEGHKNILKLPLEIMRKLDPEKNGPKYLFFKVDNISGRKRKHGLKIFDQND